MSRLAADMTRWQRTVLIGGAIGVGAWATTVLIAYVVVRAVEP